MNKKYFWIIGVFVVLLFFMVLRFGSEDSWIKSEDGLYVEHGNPSKTPDYVVEQQELILEALKLYYTEAEKGVEFRGQCLGVVRDYAVDIVSVPRNAEDDLEENQCESYRSGEVSHFIELDKYGNVVRIV